MAWLLRYLGHVWHSPEEEQALYRQAQAIFRKMGDEKGIADVLYRLGLGAINTGDYQQAERYLHDSLAAAKRIQRPGIVLNCLLELGYLKWVMGDWQTVENRIEEAQLINEEFGYETQKAWAQRIQARVALGRGDYDRAEQYLGESLAVYQKLGLQGLRAETLGEWAEVSAHAGALVTAGELAQESLRSCEELDHYAGRSQPLTILGEVALVRGNLQEADQQFQRAVQIATENWRPAYALHALGAMTRLLAARGDSEKCCELAAFLLSHPASWQWTKDNLAHMNTLSAKSYPEAMIDDEPGQTIESVTVKIFGESAKNQEGINN